MKVAVLCLLVALAVVSLAAGDSLELRANGCSTFGLSPKYSRKFRSACNRHDDCYDACRGRFRCDWRFLRNMKAICRRSSRRRRCYAHAYAFYAGVRRFGMPFYIRACWRG